jgi:hypothetical protein
MSDEITIGEIGRSLVRLEESQKDQTLKLEEIKEQTTETNGSLIRHDEWLKRHDTEIRDLKRASVERHELKRTDDRPDVITLQIPAGVLSAKTISMVLAAVVSGLVAAWKAGLFS